MIIIVHKLNDSFYNEIDKHTSMMSSSSSDNNVKTVYLWNQPFGPPILANTAVSCMITHLNPSYETNPDSFNVGGSSKNYGKTIFISNSSQDYYDHYIDVFNNMAKPMKESSIALILEIPNDAADCENLIQEKTTPGCCFVEANGDKIHDALMGNSKKVNRSALILTEKSINITANTVETDKYLSELKDESGSSVIGSSDVIAVGVELTKATKKVDDDDSKSLTYYQIDDQSRTFKYCYVYHSSEVKEEMSPFSVKLEKDDDNSNKKLTIEYDYNNLLDKTIYNMSLNSDLNKNFVK